LVLEINYIQWTNVNIPVAAYTNNDAPLLLFDGNEFVTLPIALPQGTVLGVWVTRTSNDSYAPLLQYSSPSSSQIRINAGFIRMWGSQWSQGNTPDTSKTIRLLIIGC